MLYPVLNHYCPQCSADTPVPVSAAVFSQNQHCSHCGASSIGVVVQDNQSRLQDILPASNMFVHQQQDELAGLFARNMSLNPATPPPDNHMQIPPPQTDQKPDTTPQIVYTSMHYTPTRHVVPVRFNATPEMTPERQLPLSDDELFHLLTQNSINPHALFPSQVHLIRHADPEQRLRLLELWRISPPNVGAYDLTKQQESWHTTTYQQEEDMARLRYERQIAPQFSQVHDVPRSVSSNSNDASQPVQNGMFSPPERPASAPEVKTYAEPYMASGYEMLAKRDYHEQISSPLRESTRYNAATDPVYMATNKIGHENNENYPILQDDDMEL